MMPHQLVRDLMHRTMWNLEYVEQQAGDAGPYEVTQLVNSFLAALAHPWEEYKEELNRMSIDQAERDGRPSIVKEQRSDNTPESVGDLLRYIRNSFAHGNIEFRSTGGMQITHIRFWNKNLKGKRTWGSILSIEQLRQLLACFVELADTLSDENYRNARTQKTA